MKKFLCILALTMCWACVGQVDDPEDPDIPENVDPGGASEGTRFFHRVLALDFTGAWCQYCPNMAVAIQRAQEERPGRIVDIAVHYGDAISPPVSDVLVQRFAVNAFPTAVLDLKPSTRFSQQDAARFTAYVDETVPSETCGIAFESSVRDGTLTLTLTLKAVDDGSYSAAAALVEDGLITSQTGASDRYVNRSVLRKFLGEGGRDGTIIGTLKAGEERTLSLTTQVQEPYDKQRIVAYILVDGKVINVRDGSLNEKKDYDYETDS